MTEPQQWWRTSTPTDPIGLKEAVTIVEAKLSDDGTLRKNLRLILGWLQNEKVREIAEDPRLDVPMDVASRHDAHERGVARGIEESMLIADLTELGKVLNWLDEKATEQGEP